MALQARDSTLAEPLSVPWPIALRADMVRLSQVEWRLRRAAGGACPAVASATGMTLDYIGAYPEDDRDRIKSMLYMNDLPQVVAVADGSPAALAGVRAGDALISVDGQRVDAIRKSGAESRLLADDITAMLGEIPASRPVALVLQRGASTLAVSVRSVTLCAARAVATPDKTIEAYSDDSNIAVATALIRFAANDDELALIVGHELAHIINRDPQHTSLEVRRAMEDRADIEGAALAHCAGYDVTRGAAYWPRYARQDKWAWLRSRSHRSPDGRAARILAAAVKLTCPFVAGDFAQGAGQ